jgi:hypothetical protein
MIQSEVVAWLKMVMKMVLVESFHWCWTFLQLLLDELSQLREVVDSSSS